MQQYLHEKELAARWGITADALRKRRKKGRVPAYHQDTPGDQVLYFYEAVLAWELDHHHLT